MAQPTVRRPARVSAAFTVSQVSANPRTCLAVCGRTKMHLSVITLSLVFCGLASAAPTSDPLKSPECLAALASLKEQEAAAMPKSKPSDAGATAQSRRGAAREAAWEAARRQAAHFCLGARVDSPPPPRSDHPPSRSTPAGATPRIAVRPQSIPAPASPPIQIPYPKSASFCDPTGCLLNDGTRLQRVGEHQLIGPKGLCSLQGSVLFCP